MTRSLGAAIATLLIAASTLDAQGPTPDERAALVQRAAERIRVLQQEADRLASRARSVLGELRKLEIDREIRAEEVARADIELADVTAALDAASDRVAALEAQRVADTPGVENRLVAIYQRGRGGYARLLFEADDVREFARLSRGVAAVATVDRLRIDAYRKAVRAERDALAELEFRRTAATGAQTAAVAARRALEQAIASRNRLVDDLDHRRDLAAQYVGELAAAQRELEHTVSALGADAAVPSLPLAPFRGDLEWPVRGDLLSRFGRSPSGRFGTTIVRNGIEVAAPEGTPVGAVHEGTVAYAAPFAGFGTLVIVDHDGDAFSLYGHLGSTRVAAGQRVRRGDAIGGVGTTPIGAHAVYFELRIDGRPVDPLQWLRSPP